MGIRDFFELEKDGAGLLPVRELDKETLQGHLLMTFIAASLASVIEDDYTSSMRTVWEFPLKSRKKPGKTSSKWTMRPVNTTYMKQDPLPGIFGEPPSTLFYALCFQKADVYQSEIIPGVPIKQARDCYKAFKSHRLFIQGGDEGKGNGGKEESVKVAEPE